MTIKSSVGKLLFVLIVGEIMVTSAAILAGMTTIEVAYMIIGFAGIWQIYILLCFWVDSWIKTY